MNLIKILSREAALTLIGRGFSHMKETVDGGREVYVFTATPEVLEFAKGLDESAVIFGDDKLRL